MKTLIALTAVALISVVSVGCGETKPAADKPAPAATEAPAQAPEGQETPAATPEAGSVK